MKKHKLWKHEHDIHVFIQNCIYKQQPQPSLLLKFKIVVIKWNFILRVCSSGMWCQVVWWKGSTDTEKPAASTFRVEHRSMKTVTFIRMFKTLVPIYQIPRHQKPEECDVRMSTLLQPMLHFYVHSNGIAKIRFAEIW